MYRIILLCSLCLFSCDLRDSYEICEAYLEFRFDYNMEYADSFDPQIQTVDVFVFDENYKYLFKKHAVSKTDLIQRKKMSIDENLAWGTYHLLTVGGLSDKFRITSLDGTDFIPGISTLPEFKLSLQRATDEVANQFAPLWFGTLTSIDYRADRTVWPVYLMRTTNTFHILLHQENIETAPSPGESINFSFKISTPNGSEYGADHKPLSGSRVTYHPYELSSGPNPADLAIAKINTMRLFEENKGSYRLIVYHTDTLIEVGNYDLISLLEKTKPPLRPDGTELPMQEYLDRQGEWNIIILYGPDRTADEAYIALQVQINGMIVWVYDIEI